MTKSTIGTVSQDWLNNSLCNSDRETIESWFSEAFNQAVRLDFEDGSLWLVSGNCWATDDQIIDALRVIDHNSVQTTEPGTRICTVGRDGANCRAGYAVWVGKIYEAKPRKSDGVLTWQLVDRFGPSKSGMRPSAKFMDELQELAPHTWRSDVKAHQVCE